MKIIKAKWNLFIYSRIFSIAAPLLYATMFLLDRLRRGRSFIDFNLLFAIIFALWAAFALIFFVESIKEMREKKTININPKISKKIVSIVFLSLLVYFHIWFLVASYQGINDTLWLGIILGAILGVLGGVLRILLEMWNIRDYRNTQ